MGKWSDGVTALRRTEGDGERGTAVKKCDETAAVQTLLGKSAPFGSTVLDVELWMWGSRPLPTPL